MRFASVLLAVLLVSFAFAQKQVSDDEIYDKVRIKLASDREVKGGALEVHVKDGVVTLRGEVEREKQKQKAARLARQVKGVVKVINELKVTGPRSGRR